MPAKRPSYKPLHKGLVVKHWEALLASGISLNVYCIRNGLYRSELITGVIKHLPEQWEKFRGAVGPILEATCLRCGRHFYPNLGNQKFCTYACREHAYRQTPEGTEYNRAKTRRWRAAKKAERLQELASGDETENPER